MNVRKLFLTAAVAAAVVAMSAAPANAAGTTGGWAVANPSCFRGMILAHTPVMGAVPVASPPGTVVIGPTHFQWVAHRHQLFRWTGGGWTLVSQGAWLKTQVGDTGYSTLGYYTNLSTGGRSDGTTTFTMNVAGHYKVVVQMYWFADSFVGSGDAVSEPRHTDMRLPYPNSLAYCTY